MVQSTDGNPPRVELRVEEVLRGEDRGPTVMVAWQAPGVVAPALPFIVANVRVGSQAEVQCESQNVRFRGQSGSRFRVAGGPFIARNGRLSYG